MSVPKKSPKIIEDATGPSIRSASVDKTIKSLRTLLEGDEQEQRETFAFLKRALDEDRPSGRKLFSS